MDAEANNGTTVAREQIMTAAAKPDPSHLILRLPPYKLAMFPPGSPDGEAPSVNPSTNKRPADETLTQEHQKVPRLRLKIHSAPQDNNSHPAHHHEHEMPGMISRLGDMNVRTGDEQIQDPDLLLQRIAGERKRAQRSLRNIDADMEKLTEWVELKTKAMEANHKVQVAKLQTELQVTSTSNAELKDELAHQKKENAALQTQLTDQDILSKELDQVNTDYRQLVSAYRSQTLELAQMKTKMDKMQKGLLSLASGIGQEK